MSHTLWFLHEFVYSACVSTLIKEAGSWMCGIVEELWMRNGHGALDPPWNESVTLPLLLEVAIVLVFPYSSWSSKRILMTASTSLRRSEMGGQS